LLLLVGKMRVGWWLKKLIVGLRICLIVGSIKLWREISVSSSSPRQIRVISPSQGIGIEIRVILSSRESSIHLLCKEFRKLSIGRTISHGMHS